MGDPGDWIHVAFVYDKDVASDNMKIYENGSLIASMNYSQALTGHGRLRTNRQGKADGWLKSTVDEVRISSLADPAAWVRASYYSGDDSLLSYVSQEGETETSTGGTAYFTPDDGAVENLTKVATPPAPRLCFHTECSPSKSAVFLLEAQ